MALRDMVDWWLLWDLRDMVVVVGFEGLVIVEGLRDMVGLRVEGLVGFRDMVD